MRRQSVNTQMIHARIEPKLKKSAERIYSEIGMSTGTAATARFQPALKADR
jgi:antitoxin component of RelBE/YafQ-DinJ toxin-antitoxin module